jgi:excisionase family DNA binding protein
MKEVIKEVMTAEELAKYLSFSKNWVYRKAEAGEIPGVKLGNRWRFKKSVIDKWLEQRIEEEEKTEEASDK